MLSLPKKMGSPSQGASYFGKDSYYLDTDKQGEWYGKGATLLNLSGSIKERHFEQILNGANTKNQGLVKNAFDENRNAYLDCTFSAPKSISILSYSDKKLELCHNVAIKNVLDEIESRYSLTRKGAQGVEKEVTGNLIFAKINHHENRNLDPQLHSHCLVMNMTRANDKKWRTIDDNEIFTNKMYLGQLYRNELANEVQKIGYKIDVTDREQGFFEIAGIDKDILKEFSSRRKEILSNYKKFEDFNCSDAKKLELSCLDSRERKRKSDLEKIRKETQKKLSEYDLSLEKLQDQAKAVLETKTVFDSITPNDCISHAFSDVTENESAFRREDVIKHAMKLGIGKYSFKEMEEAFEKHDQLIRLGEKEIEQTVTFGNDQAITQIKHVELFSTKEMQNIEKQVLSKSYLSKGESIVYSEKKDVEKYLNNIEKKGIKLTKGQQEAVLLLSQSRDTLNVLQGDAGAGKTYAVEHIKNVYEKQGKTVRGFAPTGKASEELADANIETYTVDYFLEKSKYVGNGFGKGELWVIDESSMLGSRKMLKFIEEAEKLDAKIILIGDTKQLQSVSAGKIFDDLQKKSKVTYCEMTEVIRQENDEMKSLVKQIKDKKIGDAFKQLQSSNKIKEIQNVGERLTQIADEFNRDRDNKIDSIIVAGSNKTRNKLNRTIRDQLVEKGHVDSGEEYTVYNNVNKSGTTRSLADSYKVGQALFTTSTFNNMDRGTEAKITAVNGQSNTISVQWWNKEKKKYVESSIDVLKHGKDVETFDVKKKHFGLNDEVVFLKPDKKVGVKNGQLGKIAAIDKDGNATILVGKEKKQKEITCNLANRGNKAYNFIDHGYALTTFKSQGSTVSKIIFCNDSNSRTNLNELYVSITRAKEDVSVYSDDLMRMQIQSQLVQDKHSTLDFSQIADQHLKKSHDPKLKTDSKEHIISKSALDKELLKSKNYADKLKVEREKQQKLQSQQHQLEDNKHMDIRKGKNREVDFGFRL